MELIEKEKKAAGEVYHDRGLLFPDEYGDYLRHTFVSLLIKESQRAGEGISILEVSAIVGHQDASITMRVYGGLFSNSTERAMEILDNCDPIIPYQLRNSNKTNTA